MNKRKPRAYIERSHSACKAMTRHYLNKCRTTYFSRRILPKIYNLRCRLSLWIYPKSDCFGCCLTCKYFDSGCREEFSERRER